MPRGRPRPPEPADLRKLARQMYEMHAAADDEALSAWPGDENLLGVLEYARRRHRALPPPNQQQRERALQASLRLQFIRGIRPMLDEAELAAIDDARAAGVTWQEIAHVLGMERPGSAANRRERLRVGQADPYARRTPEAGRRLAAERLAEEQEALRAAAAARARFDAVRKAALDLLEHVDDLRIPEEAEEWLSGVRAIVSSEEPSQTQQEALPAYLRLLILEITQDAAAKEEPAAYSETARVALEKAAAVS